MATAPPATTWISRFTILAALSFAAFRCGVDPAGTIGTGPDGGSNDAATTPSDPCTVRVIDAPTPPSALVVSSVASYEVQLRWNPSTDPAVKYYRVLSGAAQVGLVDKPSFVHRPVNPNEAYTYTVTALTDDLRESIATSSVTAVVPAAAADALSGIAPGHWYEVPNSHLADFALSEKDYPWLGQGERIGGLISDWSSGAFDTQRDRLYVHGGGHNGYFGNEVYSFDLRTLTWTNLTVPNPLASAKAECPDIALGVPCATHTYDGLEYLPPPFDRFLVIGWDGWPQTTLNLDTNRWESHPDLPTLGARTGATSAYDPGTRVVWYHAGDGALSSWNPQNGTWTLRGSSDGYAAYYRNAVVDPHRKRYIGVGQGHSVSWTIDALGTFVPTSSVLTTTGDREIEDTPNPGVEYDSSADQIVAWKGGGDIYTLDVDSLVWTRHPPVGAVGANAGNANGTFGRFRYVPSLNLFVVVNDVHQNVFVYRLNARVPHLLQRIEVTSPQAKVEANLTTSLTARAIYHDGSAIDATTEATYTSLDPRIAAVDAHGTVHALAPGHARLQVSYTDPMTRRGLVGGYDLEVIPLSGSVALDHLSIEPSAALADVVGHTSVVHANGLFHRGPDIFTRDVTCEATWTDDNPEVASFTGSLLTAHTAGLAHIRAQLETSKAEATFTVLMSAITQLTALNFGPSDGPTLKGWLRTDDTPFDAARGWGWQDPTNLIMRADRNGKNDPRLAAFVLAAAGKFHVQVPDGRYHVAAAMGDNAYGSGLHTARIGAVDLVIDIGMGNTVGGAIVDAQGGNGFVLDVVGPLNWLAWMPVNGMDFSAVLAQAKSW